MKSIAFALFALVAVMFVYSCGKDNDDEAETGITYPDSVLYGVNILSSAIPATLVNGKNYGLGAELETDASLKIVFTNLSATDTLSGHTPVWFYSDATGWVVSDYSSGSQTFTASQTGKIDVEMSFENYGISGSCRVDYCENSNSVTRSKTIVW